MNEVYLSKYTDDSGLCSLYNQPQGSVFIQDVGLEISRLKINRCPSATFIGDITVKGLSDIENTFSNKGITNQPLITILDSPSANFDVINVEGLVKTITQPAPFNAEGIEESGIEHWKKWVPNGIDIRSSSVHISELNSKYIHHSVLIFEENCTIDVMDTDTFSGDDGQIMASNTTIGSSNTKNSIKIFTYDQCHRDVKQIHTGHDQRKILTNIKINKQVYRDGVDDASESPDAVLIHSDGIIDNCKFLNIDAITDTVGNGVSSVCARNCYIKITQLKSPSGTKLGVYINKKDPPKPQEDSFGNTLCCPNGTTYDLDQPEDTDLPKNIVACLPQELFPIT